MAGIARHQATVAGGVLSVLSTGAGDPVVLLHGIPTAAELWRAIMPGLADAGHHVLAPDLPGYGQTRLDATRDHSLRGAARLLAGWLVDAGLAPAWVVGHDAGGAVAQLLAVEHPAVVTRLTLVNAIVDGSWPAPRARFATAVARLGLYRPGAAMRLVPNRWMRSQVRRGFADPACLDTIPADRILWDGKFTDPDGRAAFERHLAALTARDTAVAAAGLPAAAVPSQVVWGTEDPFQAWEVAGTRLRDLLPSPKVTLLDGCGHFVPVECPDRLLESLLHWRAEVG